MTATDSPLRVLVVDDERPARDLLSRLIRQDAAAELVRCCASGEEALRVLRSEKVDVMFLDVQMPGMNGFDMLRRMNGARMPLVIFVTAHDEFALRAFDVHAVDYLLKPFSKSRFFEALGRARERVRADTSGLRAKQLAELLESLLPAGVTLPGSYLKKFNIRQGLRMFHVPVDQVDRIESADHYTRLIGGGREYMIGEAISHLEQQLDPRVFVRIHRTTIVNVGAVRQVRRSRRGHYEVELRDGSLHRVSRRRRAAVDRVLPAQAAR